MKLVELRSLFMAAKQASISLRIWVLRTYKLDGAHLDGQMATSLRQLIQAARDRRFYGFDVTRAPDQLVRPMIAYISALTQNFRLPLQRIQARHRSVAAPMKPAYG